MGELHAELGVGSAMMRIVISTPGATGVKGAGGICRGAGGRWQGLAGLRGDAQAHVSTPGATGVEGAGGHKRAWLRCPWAAAGPGRASRRRAEPKARSADGERAGRRPTAHTAA